MANVSSFSGSLILQTSNNPWTPEGYLLAYEVLMSQECSFGNYGFTLDESIAQDSATFLAQLISSPNDSITFWGSGRWSAANNFASFNEWTKNVNTNTQKISQSVYETMRADLLKLMYDNEWFFSFIFVDEECGIGFINEMELEITAEVSTDAKKSLQFKTNICSDNEYEYNLYNLTTIVYEDREDSTFVEVVQSIMKRLDIPQTNYNLFKDFILTYSYDELLMPYTDYSEQDRDSKNGEVQYYHDLPEDLIEGWKEHSEKISRNI